MKKWIVTFLGSGYFPIAPGTAGSLLATAMLYLIFRANLPYQPVVVIGLIVSSAAAIFLGPWAIVHFGRKDPQPFVLDEVAGICITNLFLPIKAGYVIGLAFLAFRLFDVTKPPPARQLEKLPAGWGILMDDLAAGVYANLLCQVLIRFVIR